MEPTVMEFSLEKGQTEKGYYTVSNLDKKPLSIAVRTEEMDRSSSFADEARDSGLTIPVRSFILAPGEKKMIPYTVRLSSDSGREKALMVYFSYTPVERTGLNLIPRFGSAVYVMDKNDQKVCLQISAMRVIREKQGLGFEINLTNSGNVHSVPRGSLILSDEQDERMGYLVLSSSTPILANDKGSLRAWWKEYPGPGKYKARFMLFYSQDKEKEPEKIIREFLFLIDKEGRIIRE
ncbi:MAG: hypothetical protein PHF84_01705 [bacterium]|nr:hypothetical protein [bacterium]